MKVPEGYAGFYPENVERLRFWQCDEDNTDWQEGRLSAKGQPHPQPQYVSSDDFDRLHFMLYETRELLKAVESAYSKCAAMKEPKRGDYSTFFHR
jgi:hypothetical protein